MVETYRIKLVTNKIELSVVNFMQLNISILCCWLHYRLS
uniref:Uncharacterized protein n=1 Tax=Arundo donax TaxID=35708 RepID=A0A0A9H6G8_ARUDO